MTRIKPRTSSLTVYHGDDMEQMVQLRKAAETERRREVAVKAARRDAEEDNRALRLGDDDGDFEDVGTEARDAYDAFVDEAANRATVITVQALGRRRFRDLIELHPARKKMETVPPETEGAQPTEREVIEPDDMWSGANDTTYPMALLTFNDGERATIVEPTFESPAELQDFLDEDLSEGDFESLWMMAHLQNRSASSDPLDSRYLSSTATSR